jgi:GTP:adenosylcobinamide-phosphate guanylyltransferase
VDGLPLVIFANGLGTRMGKRTPKTLTRLSSGQTILGRLLDEAALLRCQPRVFLFVREEPAAFRDTIAASALPVEVLVHEPCGYLRDLAAAKRELALDDFAIVDSDLVVPTGELTRFLDVAGATTTWLTIGVSTMPERPSGRPAWVDLGPDGRIRTMDRTRPRTWRTLGAFRWGAGALDDVAPSASSVMAYIADHVGVPGGVHTVPFTGAVNVNTEADVDAAEALLEAAARRGRSTKLQLPA